MVKAENTKTIRIDLIPGVMSGTEAAESHGTSECQEASSRGDDLVISEEERARYADLFNSAYDAVLLVDPSGALMDANSRAEEFLGYTREELLSMWLGNIVCGLTDDLLYDVWEELKNEKFSLIQAYCARSNETLFPAEISASRFRLNERFVLCLFVRDTTLRRRAEEMLLTEHNAIQNAADGIAVADETCHLEYVNPAVAKQWGYVSASNLVGMDLGSLFDDPGQVTSKIDDVMASQNRWTGEVLARHADGSTFPVRCSTACNRNSDGQVVGIVVALTDLTDQMRADRAQRENEQQRVMLESLGAACHHLGQPATVLIATLGLMERERDSMSSEASRLLDLSISAGDTLTSVMHRLNEFNEYRTTRYLHRYVSEHEGSEILDI